jgi:hypothetical protein
VFAGDACYELEWNDNVNGDDNDDRCERDNSRAWCAYVATTAAEPRAAADSPLGICVQPGRIPANKTSAPRMAT